MIIDAFTQAISTPGLVWIAFAALIAGIVRGFAGFGTAMIFLPIAGQYLSPFWAIAALTVMDIFAPLPLVPRAWRDAHRPDFYRMVLGMCLVLPFSFLILKHIDPQIFRYIVSFIAIGMLIVLLLGLRYRGTVKPPLVFGIGALGGLSGGISGIPGPPVILFYMASPHGPAVIRANNMLYLMAFDFIALPIMVVSGVINWVPIIIGLFLIVPTLLGNLIGAWFFDPEKEKIYRYVAFLIIGVSAVKGLPLWG